MKIVKLFSLKRERKPLLCTGFGDLHDKNVGEGRRAGRFVRQVSRRIISYSLPQLSFSSVSSSVLYTYTFLPLYWKTLRTSIFLFLLLSPSSYFFLQGAVQFLSWGTGQGEKDSISEINPPPPPPLPTCSETLYINFRFTSLFTSIFAFSLLFAISSDQELTKIRSEVEVKKGKVL